MMDPLSNDCLVTGEVINLLVRTGYPRSAAQPEQNGRYWIKLSDETVQAIREEAFQGESFSSALERMLVAMLGGFH